MSINRPEPTGPILILIRDASGQGVIVLLYGVFRLHGRNDPTTNLLGELVLGRLKVALATWPSGDFLRALPGLDDCRKYVYSAVAVELSSRTMA